MIKQLLKLNLKMINQLHILVLIVISIIITYIRLSILNIPHTKPFSMCDIEILVFGGLDTKIGLIQDFVSFVIWILPNLSVIYLVYIYINDQLKEKAILVLPRAKSKIKWFIALNISIIILIIKYYVVLFITSSIVVYFKMGASAFKNENLVSNKFNFIIINTNQYLLVIYMFILSILTMICLIVFINNIYFIFSDFHEAVVISIIACIIPVFSSNLGNNTKKLILMNHEMLRRHNIFQFGFKGFSLGFSIIYLFIFFIINFFIGVILIKNTDIETFR